MTARSSQRGVGDRALGRAMAGLIPVTLISQTAGFASSVALASVLGATYATDAYFVALSIPLLVSGLLVSALRVGAIPALTERHRGDRGEFDDAGSELTSAVLVGSSLLSILATGFTLIVLPLLVGSADPRALPLARELSLELAPLGVLGAFGAVLGAILAVRGRFVAPIAVLAFDPVLRTVFVVVLGGELGPRALVIGNLAGAALAVAVLWGLVRREGVALRPTRTLNTSLVRQVLRLGGPLMIGQSVLFVNPLIDRAMASGLGSGSVTVLELAIRIASVPVALLGAAMITPLTAIWADRFTRGGDQALRDSLSSAVNAILAVVPPLVVLGIVLRHELATLIYRGGALSPQLVEETGSVLGTLLIGLPAFVLVIAFSTLFVVRGNPIVPMIIAFSNVILNATLNLALRPLLGVSGIALSTALTYTLLCGSFAVAAHRLYGDITLTVVRGALLRAAASSGPIALAALGVRSALPSADDRLTALIVLLAVSIPAMLVHFALLVVTRERNATEAAGRVRRFVLRGNV